MSEAVRDITGIFALLAAVGLFTVAVKQGNQTAQVIQSTFGGFAGALSAAMGNPTTGGFNSFGSLG